MSQSSENNKVITDVEDEPEEIFEFNFINMPWDNRTQNSKIGIIILLVLIFVATMGCVINYLNILSQGYKWKDDSDKELSCHMVKVDDYRFIARIYTIKNQKAICVGAIVSETVVLTSDDCTQSGPIVVRIGSWSEPRCRKNFAVDILENHNYGDKLPKAVVLLRSLESFKECSQPIRIGMNINFNATAYIIGRIQHGGKLLSRQPVSIEEDSCTKEILRTASANSTYNLICAKVTARCPVISGDLLIQNRKIYGISLVTTKLGYHQLLIPFSRINFIQRILEDM